MRLFMPAVFLMSSWGMAQLSEPSSAELSRHARERKGEFGQATTEFKINKSRAGQKGA